MRQMAVQEVGLTSGATKVTIASLIGASSGCDSMTVLTNDGLASFAAVSSVLRRFLACQMAFALSRAVASRFCVFRQVRL
jgi:hypothetical protein